MPADRANRQPPPWQSIVYGVRGGQVPPDQLRISDAERHEMTDALSKHFAEGRLDQNELDERVTRAMNAKTRGDLRGLLDDLPPVAGQAAPGPAGGGGGSSLGRAAARCGWRAHPVLLVLGVILIASALSATFTAPWHFPWLLLLIVAFIFFRPWRGRRRWHHPHSHYPPYGHWGGYGAGAYPPPGPYPPAGPYPPGPYPPGAYPPGPPVDMV